MIEFIKNNMVLTIIVIIIIVFYYYYLFNYVFEKKPKQIKNINNNIVNIKNNNIFASDESDLISTNHYDAKPLNEKANKKDWQSALKDLEETNAEVFVNNRLKNTLEDLDIDAHKE